MKRRTIAKLIIGAGAILGVLLLSAGLLMVGAGIYFYGLEDTRFLLLAGGTAIVVCLLWLGLLRLTWIAEVRDGDI